VGHSHFLGQRTDARLLPRAGMTQVDLANELVNLIGEDVLAPTMCLGAMRGGLLPVALVSWHIFPAYLSYEGRLHELFLFRDRQ